MRDPIDIEMAVQRLFAGLGVDISVISKLSKAWEQLAGPEWATRGRPSDVTNGILTVVAADGSAASFLRLRSEELLRRLDGVLGEGVISGVRVRVE